MYVKGSSFIQLFLMQQKGNNRQPPMRLDQLISISVAAMATVNLTGLFLQKNY